MILLYNILIFIILTAGLPIIALLLAFSEKRRKTVLQRLTLSGLPRMPGKNHHRPIWVHALSVGEVISAVPLIPALKTRFPGRPIVFSASTATGFATAEAQIKDQVSAVLYFPYDLFFCVRRMASRVNPEAVIIVETDIWPNFLREMKCRNVPVFWVNARLSARSFAGYRRFAFFIRPVLEGFTRICVQSELDQKRFAELELDAQKLTLTGNLKFDRDVSALSEKESEELRNRLGIRVDNQILTAGSTHEGEEEILCKAFSLLKKHCPKLRLIVAPRNPKRAEAVYRIFHKQGHPTLTMAAAEKDSGKEWDVMVVDRMGVLIRLYGLAHAAFVGGSLVKMGGHNPLEPSALGKPVLFGPHMSDFAEISEWLLKSQAAVQVQDAESLYKETLVFLKDESTANHAGRRGMAVFHSHKGALERTLNAIHSSLGQG